VRPTAAADGTPGAQDERERPARGADEDTTLIPEGPGGERYTPLTPAPAAMRRLTQAQYESSLRDVFGDALVFDRPLEPDERTESFLAVGASKVATSEQGVEQYHDAAMALAGQVMQGADPDAKLAGCAPDSAADPCIGAFLAHYGRRLYRRPLTAQELDGYAAVVGAAGDEPRWLALGMRYALAAMLQSPSFLYLIAYGESDPDSGALRFTNHELASRLSYFLWDSTPDEALLRQADAGELTTAAGRSAAVARMLDGERGEALAGRFFEEHWHINQTEGNDKDPQRFADWSAELWDAYKRELALTLHDITVSRDADLREVFTGRESFLNARLAQIYGAAPLAGDAFQKTALPDNRHGLLTSTKSSIYNIAMSSCEKMSTYLEIVPNSFG
jgi:hypothetical protein